MRILASSVLAALLMTAQAWGSGEPLTGEWVGGTDVLAGWRMAQLRFAADTGGTGWSGSVDLPSGDVMRLPLDGIQVESGRARFRVPSPYGVYTFSGRLEGDRLVGEITAPSGRLSPLHAVRSRTGLAEERAALAGAYSLPKGRRLLITPRPFGQLAAAVVEEARGGMRIHRGLALIPIAADRFVTSGSLVKALTIDETIEFARDDAGRVKAARWLAPGEREVVAPRIQDEVEQEAVRFSSGPLVLDGTIWLPRGSGPFAAIALVHGSGPVTRDNLFLRGRELARRGIAVLAFDKRGTGRGDVRWEHATFDDLADDAIAAVEFLRHHPRVDGSRVGLQGSSQAGWIIPIAAARSPDVSFAIVVSGGGVAPADQEIYRARAQTVRHGFAATEADTAAAFMERKRDYAFIGTGWEEYSAAARAASTKPWFDFVNGPLVPGEDFWRDWRAYKGYDPQAWIGRMSQPVLVLLGGDDDTHPASQAARIWKETLRAAGHSDFTVRILPGLGHALFSREDKGGVELVKETFDVLVDWLTPRVSRPAERLSAPVPR